MQGHSTTVLTAEYKVIAVKLKLKSWYHHVLQNKCDHFTALYIIHLITNNGGHTVAQWLRYCATNRKVTGLIPDGVIGIFH
jgi:hypothetical protein